MPYVDNSVNIPQVNEGAHTLRVVSSQFVEGTAFEQPDIPETKLEITFLVVTPGEDATTFKQQLSLNLGDKASLGNIYRAVMRVKDVPKTGVDTDDMDGRVFDCMVGHSSGGWPKVVNGSAYPSRQGRANPPAPAPVEEEIPWDMDDQEPPF